MYTNEMQNDDGISYKSRIVKEMPADEQPREKLMAKGADNLTTAELLAILLRTGTKKHNVLDISRMLLEESGGLNRLARRGWKHIRLLHGIGDVKAVGLEAVFELSRRMQRGEERQVVQLREPGEVAGYFGPMLRDLRKEVFVIAFLNARKVMVGHERISIGTQTTTLVDTSEVIRQAILNDAHSIIAIHNHPSGSTNVSNADILLTERLLKAGKMMGIRLEDHVIIAGNNHVSMRVQGYLDIM